MFPTETRTWTRTLTWTQKWTQMGHGHGRRHGHGRPAWTWTPKLFQNLFLPKAEQVLNLKKTVWLWENYCSQNKTEQFDCNFFRHG
jgi:hypothetical protein